MKNRLKYKLLAVYILLFIGFACKREVYNFPSVDLGYFPLDSGKYLVYEVDYVLYNDFEGTVDTSHFLLKESITKTETDNLGNTYYRIERYSKADSVGAEWQFLQVWAAQLHDNKAYRIENNQRFVALSFPAMVDKEWDGLVYIRKDTTIAIPGGTIDVYKDWGNYKIISTDNTATIAGVAYDSVLTLRRVDKINNIERRYSVEKYAKNVGLVSKQDSILDTQCGGNIATCINTPWGLKAEKGYILNMKLVETNW